MVKYRTIYFDLDHTLWDYDTNSVEVLTEIFDKHVTGNGNSLDGFLKDFEIVNEKLWDRYNKGVIDKEIIRKERFVQILERSEIEDRQLAEQISEFYLFECPRRPHLIPGTIEVLEYVQEKYEVHILTNGFDDVQEIKLTESGIKKYFNKVITSESTGFKKPSVEFFKHALEETNGEISESLMVGDNLKTDIAGARNVDMDSVYFNPSKNARPHKAQYEIAELTELLDIL